MRVTIVVIMISHDSSFQVLVDDVDEFFRRSHSRVVMRRRCIDHVLTNVVLDYFGNETVKGAAAGCRLLQNVCALFAGFNRPPNRLDLAAQSLDAIEELGLFGCNMSHDCRFQRHLAEQGEDLSTRIQFAASELRVQAHSSD